jgi:hypothetical protein
MESHRSIDILEVGDSSISHAEHALSSMRIEGSLEKRYSMRKRTTETSSTYCTHVGNHIKLWLLLLLA